MDVRTAGASQLSNATNVEDALFVTVNFRDLSFCSMTTTCLTIKTNFDFLAEGTYRLEV